MIKSLNNLDIKNIFIGGGHSLELNKQLIDALNVFPVPDGDTGTNMTMTMTSAVKEMDALGEDKQNEICNALARGALKGARGNSGVILSQIIKGITSVLSDSKPITTRVFASALKYGANVAYDVVTHPKEGTILTVIRMMSDYAVKIAPRKSDFIEFFTKILQKGEEVLASTPDMLPILKKAGVVDAGGKGLLTIFYGMYNVLSGTEMPPITEENIAAHTQAAKPEFQVDVHNLEDIKFAYCTEFFIINLFKKTTLSDIDKLRDKLNKIGDCVIVVGDLTLVKVHVHTNNPDKALGYALLLGELDKPKIENMLEQSREYRKAKEDDVVPTKAQGLVSVCVGGGLNDIFKSLNVDSVIEGGQTMNPSVSDIINIVDSIGAENVFILPNNSNIILAAEQAKELTKANVIVIATKNVPQGIAAAMSFNPDETVEENTRNMQKSAENVRSGQVTYAVRDTEMDGFDLHNGDIIGIFDGICANGHNVADVTSEVVSKMTDDTTSSITLYFGEDVNEDEANALGEKLQEAYPYHDVSVYGGGQSHYFYLISVE